MGVLLVWDRTAFMGSASFPARHSILLVAEGRSGALPWPWASGLWPDFPVLSTHIWGQGSHRALHPVGRILLKTQPLILLPRWCYVQGIHAERLDKNTASLVGRMQRHTALFLRIRNDNTHEPKTRARKNRQLPRAAKPSSPHLIISWL